MKTKAFKIFSTVMALTLGVSGVSTSVFAESNETEAGFAVKFADPENENSISTRWWIPGGAVTEDEIRKEVGQMANAGIKNVELVYFPLSVDGRFTVSEKYGWDTDSWKNVLKWAFDEGEKQGVKINLTTGPMWPSMSPLITPDDDAAEKELNFGVVSLKAGETYEGAIPKPDSSEEDSVTKEQLMAVTVAKVNSSEEVTEEKKSFLGTSEVTTNNCQLDRDSLEDITDSVVDADTENATITWTAPDDGEYLLFGFWQRGTGQVGNANSKGMIASDPQSYCIDHLSSIGVDALTQYWDSQFLSDEQISSYIKENNPEIFEDSLELIHTLLWSPKMQEEFQELRGYSMNKYLPLLFGSVDNDAQGGGEMQKNYNFTTNDTEQDALFIKDFEQTTSDMYVENHIKPLQEWCEKVGFQLKTQSYGESVDTSKSYIYTDVPEGESLEYGEDNYNAFKAVAASAHMADKKYVSAEYGAVMGSGFAQNWEDLLKIFNKIASAGVNRVILHGFPYEDYQGSDSQDPDTVIPWPGFDPFNDLFADHWNAHVPSWDYMNIYTEYVNRVQTVLQEGNANVDLAVYGESKDVINGPYYDADYLSQVGYTYDILGSALLEETDAEVKDGKLATDSISYKALIIGDQMEMSVETAVKILEYAKSGLPVYVVGDVPTSVATLNDTEAQNQTLADTFAELLALDNVKQLADSDAVLSQLAEDGITAAAVYDTSVPVYNAHRTDEDADYYFFNNTDEDAVSVNVTLEGDGVPYSLDCWSGEITPISEYEETDQGVSVQLDLHKDEAKVIAVAEAGTFGEAGESAESSEGAQIEETELPEEKELKDETWTLQVESWIQGQAEESDTSGNNIEKIELDPIETTLKSWREIEGLEDVSGIGTYTLNFTLEDGWNENVGSVLKIDSTIDNIVGMTVNNQEITRLDQLVKEYDLGNALQTGENTITIKLATTLNNAVNAIGDYKPIFGDPAPQDYGLTGNVTLVPYAIAK